MDLSGLFFLLPAKMDLSGLFDVLYIYKLFAFAACRRELLTPLSLALRAASCSRALFHPRFARRPGAWEFDSLCQLPARSSAPHKVRQVGENILRSSKVEKSCGVESEFPFLCSNDSPY